jgi:hypothetical protein
MNVIVVEKFLLVDAKGGMPRLCEDSEQLARKAARMLIPPGYWLRLYSRLRVLGTLFGPAKQLDNIRQGLLRL